MARIVSTGIASAESGNGNAATCAGSAGGSVISNIGNADGRTLGLTVRAATCESMRLRASACGSGSMVSRITTGEVRTGVIGGGAVRAPDEHAVRATNVVAVMQVNSVVECFIEYVPRW